MATPSSATTMNATTKLKSHEPVASTRHVAEIAAEQIDRAVREIDVAHQAEDQGEAARHQEIEAAERDAVEGRVEEHLLLAENASKPGGHGANTSQIRATTTTATISDPTGWRR